MTAFTQMLLESGTPQGVCQLQVAEQGREQACIRRGCCTGPQIQGDSALIRIHIHKQSSHRLPCAEVGCRAAHKGVCQLRQACQAACHAASYLYYE